MDTEAFKKRFEDELAGITLFPTREIVINEAELSMATVAHEVWHAALEGLCFSAAEVTLHQLEEITCELFALQAPALTKLSRKVYQQLRKLSE